jgi:phosphatidylinositol alpha 1,6-mannosyltransferase
VWRGINVTQPCQDVDIPRVNYGKANYSLSISLRATAVRVLYCTDTYPPQVNGVSIVTALSVDGLQQRGWDCAVITPRYPDNVPGLTDQSGPALGAATEHTAIPSVALPIYPDVRIVAPFYRTVAGAIERFKPDLVHCQTEFVLGRLGQVAARNAQIPLVSSYHTDFSKYVASYGVPWLRPVVSAYIGRFHRRSMRTYTPSAPARDDLERFGVDRVEVWGRGVDVHAFAPRRRSPSLREAYGIDDAFVLLHVGRIAPEKGVERIVEAFRIARELIPDGTRRLRLVLAGAGPAAARVRAEAPSGVIILGQLERYRALPTLYASADAFVFASLTETLGLVVLEAMASGLPVIAAPAGGVADHLRDGENGIAYPPGDTDMMARAIVRLVLDRDLHGRLSDGARRTAEGLSWERELDRLDASYREVLAEAGRAAANAVPTAPLRAGVMSR